MTDLAAQEFATAHDAEDCGVGCTHPDHSFDGPVPDLWTLLLGDLVSASLQPETADGPVWL